ncbi:hypothetical protein OROGR_025495 [Orobanche gracilis]
MKNRITYPTIYVNRSSHQHRNFTTIQAAIDSVPSYNKRWICIQIQKGVYREQIKIPRNKPFVYLKGEGKRNTYVVWDAHDSIATSATFDSQNSYNWPRNGNLMRPAVAATIGGDKSAFYRCGFIGFQDTLWDVEGRHYFKLCTIQGAVDFIFGAGQSLYERIIKVYGLRTMSQAFSHSSSSRTIYSARCTISVVAGALNRVPGYITAQGRSHDQETNGFVFKECNIVGNGNTFLGRPWRDYARVLFYNTSMSQIVVPQGWDAWFSVGRE